MTLPILLTSDMPNAPQLTIANGAINNIFYNCLVTGFNTRTASSATASSGVVTVNFATPPGFKVLDTVVISGANNATVNGKFRVQAIDTNQIQVAIPGVPDGSLAGTITVSFAPLGWTRPYTGTNLGGYRQGGGELFNRFLRVRDHSVTTTYNWFSRGYENMTAISTGTGAFPTTGQLAGDGTDLYAVYPTGSTAPEHPRPWIIVGTPRSFFFCYGGFYDNSGISTNGLLPVADTFVSSSACMSFFGDLANKIKPADTYHTAITTNTTNPLGTGSTFCLARSVTGAVGATFATTISPAGGNVMSYGSEYPSPANGGLTLMGTPFVVEIAGAYTVRGLVPGLLTTIERPASIGALNVGAIIQNVSGVNGRLLLLAAGAVQNNYDCFVTLDEDWGDV